MALLFPLFSFSQIYVDAAGNDANDGLSPANAKQTINAGIAAASAGQTVFIAAGTYAGCTLNKSVNLQGAGIGATIIQGGGSGNGIDITTSISNVTISNLSITNFFRGINIAPVNIDNLALTNISSSGNTTYGLYTNNANLNGLSIANSQFNNNNTVSTGRGVWITGTAGTHANIVISNSQFNDNGLVGFDLALHTSLNNLSISACEFRNNGDAQLSFYEGHSSPANSEIVISNNIIEMGASARFGIEAKNTVGTGLTTGNGRVVISDNRVFKTATGTDGRDVAGIAVICRREGTAAYPEPSGVVIINNTIEDMQPGDGSCGTCGGNFGEGFGIAAGGNNHRILNNVISGCQIGIQLQGGNINAGTANSSPSTNGNPNTLYFDRDNSTTANGNIVRYNNIVGYTFKAMRLLQNSNFLPNDVNDMTGNWLGSATFTLTDIESYLVSNPNLPPNFVATLNANLAFNPWAAVNLDDVAGNNSGERGVQINSSKEYRATATETTTSIGVIPQGILIANTAFKDVLDIRTGTYNISANVIVNKAITLLGNGGSGTRPMLVMQNPCESILVASAPNITIQYLHLQVIGAGGTSTNGKHGIFVANHTTPGSYNNLEIFQNYIENISPGAGTISANSYAIRLSENNIIAFTAGNNLINIQGNIITTDFANNASFSRAIRSIGNYGTISNNQILTGGLYGIQWGDARGNTTIQNNLIQNCVQAGIELNIPVANTTHDIINNTINITPAAAPNTFCGIEIKDNINNNCIINIQNNTIQGHQNVGIWLGRSQNVNIVSNTLTPLNTATAYTHLVVNTKNRTTAASAGAAITVENISIRGNSFNHSSNFGGAGIAFANHHSGATPAFNNITIGTATERNNFQSNIAVFVGLDPYYGNSNSATLTLPLGTFPNPYTAIWTGVPVTTMASVTNNFNAVENNFDVGTGLKTPATMTNPELILLENRIQHTIDYGALGFVTVKPNHVFVTQNSFILPAFTNQPRIRRGTNVINADGFTLNVEQGTYNDDGSATDRPLTAFNMDFVPVGASPVISQNWELNGTNKTMNMLGDLTINNQMYFTDGFVQTNANTLNFTPTAIDPAANPATVGEKNDSRIVGRARTIRNVGTAAFDFLGLNLPAGADIGTLDLLRVSDVAGIVTTPSGISIACTWYIEPSVANGRNGVEFRWLPAINNAKDVNNLQAWRNNGTEWEPRSTPFAAPSTSPLITSVPINITAFSPWTISDVLNPLPVELLYIQAVWNKNHLPEVQWATAAEINTDHFEIERSYNNKDFVKVGIAQAKGSNSFYTFEDNSFSSKTDILYYRLRQVDKDGKFTYSRVVSLRVDAINDFSPKIYPNPTNGTLFVELLIDEPVFMRITDMYGKQMYQFTISTFSSKFELGYLPKGVYFLQFEAKKGISTMKLVLN
ncbi:MAG: hypothetical protein OHK0045_11310 [Raineya sp.]